jgi:hypothetical protein
MRFRVAVFAAALVWSACGPALPQATEGGLSGMGAAGDPSRQPSAGWAPRIYTVEYEACVPPCDHNNPTGHDKCVAYCHCVMDGLQAKFPDHAQLNSGYANKVEATLTAMQTIANACNQRTFGGNARPVQ